MYICMILVSFSNECKCYFALLALAFYDSPLMIEVSSKYRLWLIFLLFLIYTLNNDQHEGNCSQLWVLTLSLSSQAFKWGALGPTGKWPYLRQLNDVQLENHPTLSTSGCWPFSLLTSSPFREWSAESYRKGAVTLRVECAYAVEKITPVC